MTTRAEEIKGATERQQDDRRHFFLAGQGKEGLVENAEYVVYVCVQLFVCVRVFLSFQDQQKISQREGEGDRVKEEWDRERRGKRKKEGKEMA